jgi:hypothetical protein
MLSAVVGWCAISAAGVFYLHHTNPQHWFFVFVEEKVFPLLKEHTGVDVMETLKLKEEPPPPILYASSAAFVGKKASKQKKAAKDANKEKAAKKAAKEKAAKALSLERPADGNLYTRQEFADQYGGAIEWDAAGEEEEARRDDTWTLVEKKVEQDWWGEQVGPWLRYYRWPADLTGSAGAGGAGFRHRADRRNGMANCRRQGYGRSQEEGTSSRSPPPIQPSRTR